MGLTKVDGIDCPKCGCNATSWIDAGRRGNYLWNQHRCDHCDHTWTISGRASESRPPATCKSCGSTHTKATSTPGRVQRRRCLDCGEPFTDVK